MAFTNFYITDQGSALLAKAQIGGSLTYTKAAAGDGQLGTQQPTALTAMIDKVMDLSISGYDGSTPGTAAVEIEFSNQTAPNPFYWREIGLFAKGDDGVEILYAYGNAGSNADFIPSYGVTPIEFLYYLSTKIGNAANVTATIDSSLVFAKKADVDTVSQQVTALQNSLASVAKTGKYSDLTGQPDYFTATPPYAGTTTHTANAYAISCTGYAYTDGWGLIVKFDADSTGAATLNVNNLGAVALVDGSNKAVTTIKAGTLATVRYNGTNSNFQLSGKGGYGVGDNISLNNLSLLQTQYAEAWSLTDVTCTHGICADNSGNIYVAYYQSPGTTTVRKLNSSGAQQWALTDIGSAVSVFTDSVYLYVTYSVSSGTKNVRKLRVSDGSEVWSLTDIGYAYDICTDNSGNVYVAYRQLVGTTGIRKLNSSGVQQWALTDAAYARAVAADNNYLYVAYDNSSGNKTVRKLNLSDGSEVWNYKQTANAKDVCVDNSGNVYVAFDSEVLKLNSSDTSGQALTYLSNPNAVFADNTYLYVACLASSGTQNVSKFALSNLSSIWSISDVGEAYGICTDSSGNICVTYYNSAVTKNVRKIYGQTIYKIIS